MPKNTFFNLEQGKKNRIIKAGFNEFYNHKFNDASINNIVKEAKISKGSFYQYFEDKYDVYKYLIDIIAQEKISYLTDVIEKDKDMDFFELLRNLYIKGFAFAKDHPIYYKIACNLLKDNELKEKIYKDYNDMGNHFMINILSNGIKNGSIRSDIDINLVATLIRGIDTVLVDYFLENIDENGVSNLIDAFIDFIKNGIKGI